MRPNMKNVRFSLFRRSDYIIKILNPLEQYTLSVRIPPSYSSIQPLSLYNRRSATDDITPIVKGLRSRDENINQRKQQVFPLSLIVIVALFQNPVHFTSSSG